jgi:cell wall-associated NlpC family hydrolase
VTRSQARPALTFALVVAATLAVATSATAEPSVDSKEAEAQRVLVEIQQIDAEVGVAAEAYNLANLKLDRIERQRKENRARLRIAKLNLVRAQAALRARVVALYTADAEVDSSLEVLLGAQSLDDLLNRLDTIDRVSELDTRVLREVRAFGVSVRRHAVELKKARDEQARLVEERAAQKAAIERKLVQRRSLLASIRSEIAQIQARERARSLAIARRVRAQQARQRPVQQEGEESSELGIAAATPEGVSVAPPSRHGGVVGIAMQYLGVPYKWGGSSPSTGFDCSGFTMYVFAQVGVSLPHYTGAQWAMGVPVSREDLQPGDLVFFHGLGHMGIYIGGGSMIHAPQTGDVVKISPITSGWYAQTYVGARRIL